MQEFIHELEERMVAYVKNNIIPDIKKKMAEGDGRHAKGFDSSGQYSKQLKASVRKRAGAILGVDITSTFYADKVEGENSGFTKEEFDSKAPPEKEVMRWYLQKKLRFKNKKTGKVLEPLYAAHLIRSKWRREGKPKRFFIDMIFEQHREEFESGIRKDIEELFAKEIMKKMEAK
jgi:hypothetical protein